MTIKRLATVRTASGGTNYRTRRPPFVSPNQPRLLVLGARTFLAYSVADALRIWHNADREANACGRPNLGECQVLARFVSGIGRVEGYIDRLGLFHVKP